MNSVIPILFYTQKKEMSTLSDYFLRPQKQPIKRKCFPGTKNKPGNQTKEKLFFFWLNTSASIPYSIKKQLKI